MRHEKPLLLLQVTASTISIRETMILTSWREYDYQKLEEQLLK